MKVKVVITGMDDKKQEFVLPLENLCLSHGNFSGFGPFKKLKIKEITE
jgi:hypothetical protein